MALPVPQMNTVQTFGSAWAEANAETITPKGFAEGVELAPLSDIFPVALPVNAW